jgi:hypothetical protein
MGVSAVADFDPESTLHRRAASKEDLMTGDEAKGRVKIPLARLSTDVRGTVQVAFVELLDAVDVAHEVGKAFELRPLVVGGPHVDFDVDGRFDLGHVRLLGGRG